MRRIVLASKSPRRFELLSMTGLTFEVMDAKVNEGTLAEKVLLGAASPALAAGAMAGLSIGLAALNPKGASSGTVSFSSGDTLPTVTVNTTPSMYEKAEKICCSLAEAKAKAALDNLEWSSDEAPLVIGSDTIVVTEDEILGKPDDEADARRMLTILSGKTHRVYTGVAILSKDLENRVFSAFADVRFHDLDDMQKDLIEKYIATGSPMDKAGAYGIQDEGALLIDSISGDYYAVVGLPIAQVNRELRKILG
ncbi:MAG: septum formation protein Maf [Clostridiales bacterium]|nr:septum formation protein Maf [Clostridiales bacterium]